MAIPAQPRGVVVTTGTVQNILTWNRVPGAASYKIYIDDSVTPIATVNDPTATYTHNAVVWVTYSYTITAHNSDGDSIPSFPSRFIAALETHASPATIPGLANGTTLAAAPN